MQFSSFDVRHRNTVIVRYNIAVKIYCPAAMNALVIIGFVPTAAGCIVCRVQCCARNMCFAFGFGTNQLAALGIDNGAAVCAVVEVCEVTAATGCIVCFMLNLSRGVRVGARCRS